MLHGLLQDLLRRGRSQQLKASKPTSRSARNIALTSLLENTEHLLKTGATPDVVNFAQQTLDSITQSARPLILAEHHNDTLLLDQQETEFADITNKLNAFLLEIQQRETEESMRSSSHYDCRALQRTECGEKLRCEQELEVIWGNVVFHEQKIMTFSDNIVHAWCALNPDKTAWEFRLREDSTFSGYLVAKQEVEYWWAQYHPKFAECTREREEWEERERICDEAQIVLEEASCAHSFKVADVRKTIREAWAAAIALWEATNARIQIAMTDRKSEWNTMGQVACLLNSIHDRASLDIPCDQDTLGNPDETCTTDVVPQSELDDLHIELRPNPPFPADPPIPPHPCTADFELREYSVIRGWELCAPIKDCHRCIDAIDNEFAEVLRTELEES